MNGGEGQESRRKTSNKLIEWTVRLERIKHPPISVKQHLPNPLVYMLLWRGAYTGTTYRELISAIGALKCARQFVPPSTLETKYNSQVIRPYLDYYSVVWEGLDSEFSLKLQKLQNRTSRIIAFPVMILSQPSAPTAWMAQAFYTQN